MASAHVETGAIAAVRNHLLAGDRAGALTEWKRLSALPRLLFAEPSPGPIKHWLWRAGLVDSAEMHLPMAPITARLALEFDRAITLYGR